MKQIRTDTGICHFRMERKTGLREFLISADLGELGLPSGAAAVDEWMQTGSVYVDGQRRREDCSLSEGQVIRLHTRRKRYPAAALGNWRQRIVSETDGFLVFDKPSGLPTHPTLDNFVENAKYVLEQELKRPLYTTHRLDIPTRGLLIFAKTPEAQSRINRIFARGLAEKRYVALSTRRVLPGTYIHYIDPETKVPRTISSLPQPGWWECRLEVEESRADGWHRVRLLTGKTHQIRAQFAALEAPLLGDTQYGGPPAAEFGLECAELAFSLSQIEYRIVLPGARR